jgi:hypothetical protein
MSIAVRGDGHVVMTPSSDFVSKRVEALEEDLALFQKEPGPIAASMSHSQRTLFFNQRGEIISKIRGYLDDLQNAPPFAARELLSNATSAMQRLREMNSVAEERQQELFQKRKERASEFEKMERELALASLSTRAIDPPPRIDDPEVRRHLEDVILGTRAIAAVGDAVGAVVHAGISKVCHVTPTTLKECRRAKQAIGSIAQGIETAIPVDVKQSYREAPLHLAAYGIPQEDAKRFVQEAPGALFDLLGLGAGLATGTALRTTSRARQIAERASYRVQTIPLACEKTAPSTLTFSSMQHNQNALSIFVRHLEPGHFFTALKKFEQMPKEAGVKKLIVQCRSDSRIERIVEKLKHPRPERTFRYLGEFPHIHQPFDASLDEGLKEMVFHTFELTI